MVPTPAIRNLIRDDKIHQIYGSMQTGQEKFGMQTANQSLATLYMKRLITLETALAASSLKDELQDMINRGAGVVAGAGLGPRPGVARRGREILKFGIWNSEFGILILRIGHADFRIRRTDARGTDGERRARRRHDGRGGRRAPARADPRHADQPGQGEGAPPRQEGARPASWARRSRRRTSRCSRGSSR